PIYKSEEQLEAISTVAQDIMKTLRSENISVKYDDRTTQRPGAKFAQHELQGVPLRIAIGPKDLEKGTVEVARRDTLSKTTFVLEGLSKEIKNLLTEIQESLYKRAFDFRDAHITEVDTFEAFKEVLEDKGGFISAHWDGTAETEQKIKDATKATIRCIPYDAPEESGVCVLSGAPSKGRVLFAKAY
ncbi:MAG: His/Gly/Thr/Pro-type tRNA ligase C-terminal domain-containing protein, partial [Flavobacteriaceae bacterium]